MPISARPAIRQVSPMNWSATSSGPPPPLACARQRPSIAAVIAVIMPTCAATRWVWKAGCDIRRKRRQAAPSVVTRPLSRPDLRPVVYPAPRVILLPVEQDVLDVVRVRHGVRHIGPGPHPEDVAEPATRLDQEHQGVALKSPDWPERTRHALADPGRNLPRGQDRHDPYSSSK